jgi:hypothetical protein
MTGESRKQATRIEHQVAQADGGCIAGGGQALRVMRRGPAAP